MDRDSAVVPSGYVVQSYTCVRSLAEHGVRTVVASEYRDVPARGSRFCDEFVEIPSSRNDLLAYKDALRALASRPTVRTVTPFRPEDPYVFAKYRAEFDRHVTIVSPPMRTLDVACDRMALAAAATEAGVSVPETQLLDEVTDWSGDQIVKSRYNLLTEDNCPEFTARDSAVTKDVVHLGPNERPDVPELQERMGHVPIVQEYVRSSAEYVFAALYDRGNPLATFQHRQIRGDSYVGGGGVYRKSVAIPELESAGRRLLDHLDWHGLACIEFMRDERTGEFKLTEINPRFWQSLPCAIRAGADFPYNYWLLATGRADEIDPTYEVGVGSHTLYGELGHLFSVLRDESSLVDAPSMLETVREIGRSCFADPNFDVVRLDDPLPTVLGVVHLLRKERTIPLDRLRDRLAGRQVVRPR